MIYSIGPLVGAGTIDDPFRAPDGAVGMIDLRSPDGAAGVGFFASPAPLPSEWTQIASGDIRDTPPAENRRSVFASALGLPSVDGSLLIDWLWDAIAIKADPDGAARCLPLMPTSRGTLDLRLGGHSLIKRARFNLDSPEGATVTQALQRQYRKHREDAKAGRLKDGEHHRRILDFWGDKFRADPSRFIPRGLPREPRLKHETTLNDTFNRADQAGLGTSSGGWTWTNNVDSGGATCLDIVSNRAEAVALGTDLARANSDLSSDDHYSEIAIITQTRVAGTAVAGVIARKDSTATATFYLGDLLKGSGAYTARLFRCISGSFTAMGTNATSFSTGYALRLTTDGSNIDVTLNAGSEISTTDTNITGNLRCGLRWERGNASNTVNGDSYEAADVGGGGGIAVPVVYHHRQMMSA